MRRTNPQTASAMLVGLAAVTGLALTCVGLSTLDWPEAIPWVAGGGALRFALFLVVITLAVAGASRALRVNPLVGGVAVLAAVALAAGAVWPVLLVAWMAAAFAVAGRLIVGSLGGEPPEWLVCGVVGAGAYGTMIGLLAHFPVNAPGLYGAGLALPILAARRTRALLAADLMAVARPRAAAGPAAGHGHDVALAVLGILYAVVAMMPEVGHDALAQHLFIPIHLAAMHRWAFDAATYAWAVMPLLADWLFALANMLAGETAARLVNVLSTLALAGLVHALASWAGGTPGAARWAALLFLSTPLTFTETASLFVEAPWAAFLVTGILALLRSATDGARGRTWLSVAGIALGCALAAKAVTLAILPALLVVVLAQHRAWATRASARAAATALALLLVLGSVPYVTAWWVTGNPVFPFLNAVFHSPQWMPTNFVDARWGRGVSWDLPYRVTFQTPLFMESSPGGAGFQWLLVALPAVVLLAAARHRRGLILVFLGLASVVLCFHDTAYLRYVFPVYAIVAAFIAPALDRTAAVSRWTAPVLRSAAALAAALNLLFLSAGPFVYRDFPLEALLGKPQRDDYVARRMPMRRVVEVVNELNAARAPVVVLADPLGAGLGSDVLYTNWYNRGWTLAFAGARSKQEMARVLEGYGVEYAIVDDSYPFQRRAVELLEATTKRVGGLGTFHIRRFRREPAVPQ